jgi:hypothetical protein
MTLGVGDVMMLRLEFNGLPGDTNENIKINVEKKISMLMFFFPQVSSTTPASSGSSSSSCLIKFCLLPFIFF